MYSNKHLTTEMVGTKTIKTNIFLYPDYYTEDEINKAIQNNDCIFLLKKSIAMPKDVITNLPMPGQVYNSKKYKLYNNTKNINNYTESNNEKQEKIIPPLFFFPKINYISEQIEIATNVNIVNASKITIFLLAKIIKTNDMSITFSCEQINECFIEFCNILLTKAEKKQDIFFNDYENYFFKQTTSPHQNKINIVNTVCERSKREKYFTLIIKKEKSLKYPKINIDNFQYTENNAFNELCNIFRNILVHNKNTEKNYIKKIIATFEPNCTNEHFEKFLFLFLNDNIFLANKKNI